MKTTLEILTGKMKGQFFSIPTGENSVILGRGTEALFSIPDPEVSRRHAILKFAKGKWFIQDQGSHSGIQVNRERVPAKALYDGDVITVGNVTMRIHIAEIAENIPGGEHDRDGGLDDEYFKTDKPEKSFFGWSFLVLGLYYFGLYIGGLVLNIIFLVQANRIKQESGKQPKGWGCLITLMIAHAVGLLVLIILLIIYWKPFVDIFNANWIWLLQTLNLNI